MRIMLRAMCYGLFAESSVVVHHGSSAYFGKQFACTCMRAMRTSIGRRRVNKPVLHKCRAGRGGITALDRRVICMLSHPSIAHWCSKYILLISYRRVLRTECVRYFVGCT